MEALWKIPKIPQDVEEGLEAVHSYVKELIREGYITSKHERFRKMSESEVDKDVLLPKDDPKPFANLVDIFKNKLAKGPSHHNCLSLSHHICNVQYATGIAFFIGSLLKIHQLDGAKEFEDIVVQYVAENLGFTGPCVEGYFVSGASIGTIVAVDLARQRYLAQGGDINKAVVYTDEAVHYCIMKALYAMGMLSHVTVRIIRHFDQEMMDVVDLERKLLSDIKNKLKPLMLYCTCGTSDQGAVDNIPVLTRLAKEHDAWLHLDGAIGGFFLYCKSLKEVTGSLHQVDSVTLDSHKSFYQPYGVSMILAKKAKDAGPVPDVQTYTTARHFMAEDASTLRAFSMWFSVALLGPDVHQKSLEEKILLSQYLHDRLSQIDGIVVKLRPKVPVINFRVVGKDEEDGNAKSRELQRRLIEEGNFYPGQLETDGYFWVRFYFMNFRFHLCHMDILTKVVTSYIASLVAAGNHVSSRVESKAANENLAAIRQQLQAYEDRLIKAEDNSGDDLEKTFQWVRKYLKGEIPSKDKKYNFTKLTTNKACLVDLLDQIECRLSMNNIERKTSTPEALVRMDTMNANAHFLMVMENLFTSVSFYNPAMLEAEYRSIEWVGKQVGIWQDTSNGVLAESEDISNLLAIASAREYFLEVTDKKYPECTRPITEQKLTIYIPNKNGSLALVQEYMTFLGYRNYTLQTYSKPLSAEKFEGSSKDPHHIILIIAPNKGTNPNWTLPQLQQLRISCQSLWIHLIQDDLSSSGLGPAADSVTVDLARPLCLYQPMTLTIAKDNHFLKKAMTPGYVGFKPDILVQGFPGYYAIELCLELTRPARGVVLWFIMQSLGIKKLLRAIQSS